MKHICTGEVLCCNKWADDVLTASIRSEWCEESSDQFDITPFFWILMRCAMKKTRTKTNKKKRKMMIPPAASQYPLCVNKCVSQLFKWTTRQNNGQAGRHSEVGIFSVPKPATRQKKERRRSYIRLRVCKNTLNKPCSDTSEHNYEFYTDFI